MSSLKAGLAALAGQNLDVYLQSGCRRSRLLLLPEVEVKPQRAAGWWSHVLSSGTRSCTSVKAILSAEPGQQEPEGGQAQAMRACGLERCLSSLHWGHAAIWRHTQPGLCQQCVQAALARLGLQDGSMHVVAEPGNCRAQARAVCKAIALRASGSEPSRPRPV